MFDANGAREIAEAMKTGDDAKNMALKTVNSPSPEQTYAAWINFGLQLMEGTVVPGAKGPILPILQFLGMAAADKLIIDPLNEQISEDEAYHSNVMAAVQQLHPLLGERAGVRAG